jgi:hypothetical protein
MRRERSNGAMASKTNRRTVSVEDFSIRLAAYRPAGTHFGPSMAQGAEGVKPGRTPTHKRQYGKGKPMNYLTCLTCKERFAYRRGNCIRCHGRYANAVRSGKTTWVELEEKGLALPAKRRGHNWMPGRR